MPFERPLTTETLVTPEMTERCGRWLSDEISPPVDKSDIRRWAAAVYWPSTPPSMFWDEDEAAAGLWGGIVAPEDFNPFAWSVPRRRQAVEVSRVGFPIDAFGIPTLFRDGEPWPRELPPVGGMNTGRRDDFSTPIKPGDVVTLKRRLTGWTGRTTRLGPTLFVTLELLFSNQRGVKIRRREQSMLRYFTDIARGG